MNFTKPLMLQRQNAASWRTQEAAFYRFTSTDNCKNCFQPPAKIACFSADFVKRGASKRCKRWNFLISRNSCRWQTRDACCIILTTLVKWILHNIGLSNPWIAISSQRHFLIRFSQKQFDIQDFLWFLTYFNIFRCDVRLSPGYAGYDSSQSPLKSVFKSQMFA